MSYSFACETGDHEWCMSRSCSCYCGHPGRMSLEERDAVLAAPRPPIHESRISRIEKTPTFQTFKKGTRTSRKTRQTRPSPGHQCRGARCITIIYGRAFLCDPCKEARAAEAANKPARRRPGPGPLTLPDEQLADVIARYEAGATMDALAKELGYFPTTLRGVLERAGATIRGRGGRPPVELPLEEAIARYNAGEDLRDLADAYGCAPMSVRRRLIEAGVTIRPSRNAPRATVDIEEARELYESGLTLREVAEKLGTSSTTLRPRLAAAGVTIRPRAWKPLPDHELAERYNAGEPAHALAADYGVDEGTIRAHLRRIGVTIRPGGPERVVIDLDELLEAYDSGKSTEYLAEAYSCSPQTITRRLAAAGRSLRPVGSKPNGASRRVELPVPIKDVARRYKLGWSLEDLGVEYGVSWTLVRDRLIEAGVEIRGQGKRGDGIRRRGK